MPSAICKGCGRATNSTVSNYWWCEPDKRPTECYSAYVDGKWVEGCAYNRITGFDKYFATKLINEDKTKENKNV